MLTVSNTIWNNKLGLLEPLLMRAKHLRSQEWFDLAYHTNRKHIFPLLLHYGCDPVPHMMNTIQSYDYMLEWIKDQETLDRLLCLSVSSPHQEYRSKTTLLLEHGADPNTKELIWELIRHNDKEMIRLFIHYHVDLSKRNKRGRTARQCINDLF